MRNRLPDRRFSFASGTPIVWRALTDSADPRRTSRHAPSGFSLIELVVVMAVAVLLTGLMMPAMRQIHENAQRIVCMSNMQEIGHGFIMYGGDNNDELPESAALENNETPQNLMMSRRLDTQSGWDGVGHLFGLRYCDNAECFYCPSHHGEHPFERYERMWQSPTPSNPIFTNYHYSGHIDWQNDNRRRSLLDGNLLVLTTDGLRTASDFNHVQGMNVLRADCSVRWRDDTDNIYQLLPRTASEPPTPAYQGLWDIVEETE